MGNMYYRADMARIEVEGEEPHAWASAAGAARTARGFEPLTLRTVRSDETIPMLARLMGRVGLRVSVRIEQLGWDAEPSGSGIVVEGVLERAAYGASDANSAGAVFDEVEVRPRDVRSLR